MNTETLLLIEYHIDAFNIFDDMTMLDMHTYIGMIEHQVEKKNKKLSNATKLSTQLRALKSVLNAMDI
jgi:hypothetical protein